MKTGGPHRQPCLARPRRHHQHLLDASGPSIRGTAGLTYNQLISPTTTTLGTGTVYVNAFLNSTGLSTCAVHDILLAGTN